MESKVSIYERSLELLKNIIGEVFEGEDVTVVLFGSRARGDYLETSDMDLGILPKGDMARRKIVLLRERIEISNIPYKVDIVDLSEVSKELSDNVLKEGLLLWKR